MKRGYRSFFWSQCACHAMLLGFLLSTVMPASTSAQQQRVWAPVKSAQPVLAGAAETKTVRAVAVSQDSSADGPGAADGQASVAPLTLKEALDLARESNPALQAKREELGVAEGKLQQASTYFQNNPVIFFQLGNRHTASTKETETTASADIGGFPGSFLSGNRGVTSTNSNDTTDWGIGLSQEFEVFGQPRARRNAFASARDSVAAEIASVEWDVLARVRVQFYAAQIVRLKLELAEEQHAFATSVLDLTRRRFDAGDISRLDFRQIEIQTAGSKTNLFTTRGELETALGSLRLTLGIPASRPCVCPRRFLR